MKYRLYWIFALTAALALALGIWRRNSVPSITTELSCFSGDSTYTSLTLSGVYETSVSESDFDGTPRWTLEDEHPPLCARDAIALVSEVRERDFPNGDEFQWQFESAKLVPFDKFRWYWVVTYRMSIGVQFGSPAGLHFIVKMNGEVLPLEHSKTFGPKDPTNSQGSTWASGAGHVTK